VNKHRILPGYSELEEAAMEIEYDLTVQDMAAFLRYHQKNGPKAKPHPLIRVILAGLVFALVMMARYPAWLSEEPWESWISGCSTGVIIGFFALILLGLVLNRRNNANLVRLFERQEGRWQLAWRCLKIGPDGFEITNEYQRLYYHWSVVWLIDSTEEHTFFCTSVNQAHIIPRRAFRHLRDFEKFVDLACRYHRGLPPRESTTTDILDALPVEQTGITLPRTP
jgi:hypothetical protein